MFAYLLTHKHIHTTHTHTHTHSTHTHTLNTHTHTQHTADIVHGDQDNAGLKRESIASRSHILSIVSGPITDPTQDTAELSTHVAHSQSVSEAGPGQAVPAFTAAPVSCKGTASHCQCMYTVYACPHTTNMQTCCTCCTYKHTKYVHTLH